MEIVDDTETSEPRAISNYIWRDDNYEDMSLYEMIIYTEIEKTTPAKMRTYMEKR
jgi:hypothetical protein